MFDGTHLHGDPLVGLLCSRNSGQFTPCQDQPEDTPVGWVYGKLVTRNLKKDTEFSSDILARCGGQLSWNSSEPGSRHCDFRPYGQAPEFFRELVVTRKSKKEFSESGLGQELLQHGWELVG